MVLILILTLVNVFSHLFQAHARVCYPERCTCTFDPNEFSFVGDSGGPIFQWLEDRWEQV